MSGKVIRPGDSVLRDLYALLDLCAEKGVDESISHGINKVIENITDRDDYCNDMSSPASEALTILCNETKSHPFEEAFKEGKSKCKLNPRMMSGTLEGNFLQSLVSMSKAKRVLEIGMFTGYAALACAEVLPEDGEVVTCENDPYCEELAKRFFTNSPHGKKIKVRIGDAMDTLEVLAKEKQQFDVVFIDANKDGYIGYFKSVMSNKLLTTGGTIIFDNALMGGVPYARGEVAPKHNGLSIKKCNEFLKTRTDIHRIMVPVRDGVLIVRRREDMYGSA